MHAFGGLTGKYASKTYVHEPPPNRDSTRLLGIAVISHTYVTIEPLYIAILRHNAATLRWPEFLSLGVAHARFPFHRLTFLILQEDGLVVNRVEVDTTFDFTKVRMLLVSTPSTCWEKPGFAYVNLVLFTEKPVPLLLPYLYQRDLQPDNDLRQWVFINKKGERARHEVSQLEDVEAE